MVTVTRELRRPSARPGTGWHAAVAWTRSVPGHVGVLRVQGGLDEDQEGEGAVFDTLVRAELRQFHLVHVGVAMSDGIVMPPRCREVRDGQVSAGVSRGGARAQRETEGAGGWTWSSSRSSMGSNVIYARHVFDQMAE